MIEAVIGEIFGPLLQSYFVLFDSQFSNSRFLIPSSSILGDFLFSWPLAVVLVAFCDATSRMLSEKVGHCPQDKFGQPSNIRNGILS